MRQRPCASQIRTQGNWIELEDMLCSLEIKKKKNYIIRKQDYGTVLWIASHRTNHLSKSLYTPKTRSCKYILPQRYDTYEGRTHSLTHSLTQSMKIEDETTRLLLLIILRSTKSNQIKSNRPVVCNGDAKRSDPIEYCEWVTTMVWHDMTRHRSSSSSSSTSEKEDYTHKYCRICAAVSMTLLVILRAASNLLSKNIFIASEKQ